MNINVAGLPVQMSYAPGGHTGTNVPPSENTADFSICSRGINVPCIRCDSFLKRSTH